MRHNRNNLTNLIKEELVKRFDSVVRDEIKRHDLSVERSNKDISLLKELFLGFKTGHEKLRIQHAASFKETQDLFTQECQNQKNSFDSQRRSIRENCKRVDEFIEDFKNKIDGFITYEAFDKYGLCVNESFLDLKKHLYDYSNIQYKNFHKSEIKLMKLLDDVKYLCTKRFGDIDREFNSLSDKFQEYRVDAIGVLKELQVYKKTVFIMQKKIENIYTLIERLNKRVC